MIDFISSWAKSLGISIIAVSILEMLLPNNKTKKYIRMVMGIYILFSIISPFVQNGNLFSLDNIDLDNYSIEETSSSIDQTSMNERIGNLYKEELEKDITKKLNEKGFNVDTCKVSVKIADGEDETKITKILLKIKKDENYKEETTDEDIENKIVLGIQKIKKVDTTINKDESENTLNKSKKQISKTDIQNIKKFLIEEYGVNEKCLEIN